MKRRKAKEEIRKEKELEFQTELMNHNRKSSLPYPGVWYKL